MWRARVRTILLAAGVLAGTQPVAAFAAEPKTVRTIPVQRLPAAKPRVAKPVPVVTEGPDAWLSVTGGYVFRGDADLASKGFGGYLGNDAALVGFRARYMEGFSGLRHGRELALLAGPRFGPRDRFWLAAGIAQLDYERRDSVGRTTDRREGISLPLELVWNPHGRHFGGELRFEASISEYTPVYTVGGGFSFGKP